MDEQHSEDSSGNENSLNRSLQSKCILDDMKSGNDEGCGGVGITVASFLNQTNINYISEFIKQELSSPKVKKQDKEDIMAKEESSLLNTSTASATAAAAAAASASTSSAGAASTVAVKKTDPIFMEADGGGGGGVCDSNTSSFNNAINCNNSCNTINSNSSNSNHDGPKLFDGFKHVNPRSTSLTSTDINSFQSTEMINSIIQDSLLSKIDVSNPLLDVANPHQASTIGSAEQSTFVSLASPLTASLCHYNDQLPAQLSLTSFGTPRSPTSSFNTLQNSNNNNTSSFETKVKQIAKNLKETSLTDTQSQTAVGNVNTNSNARKLPMEDNNPSSSTSTASPSISSSSISIDYDTSLPSNNADDVQCIDNSELNISLQSVSESTDDTDHRSKKVRFHPDVKENDGGNRIIPKKKKKLKLNPNACVDEAMPSTSAAAAAANAIRMSNGDDDMETEEEEDEFDEEEDFDLEKTIAEANDFLKEHPLTFARAQDKRIKRIRNGLYDEEDLPQAIDFAEDEENFYEHIQPENGIERILGKQTKGNKVEFLLRYVDRPGLYWEQGDFISRTCPMLLDIYEMFRERRQERLMRYVATRQNIRQRYTDF